MRQRRTTRKRNRTRQERKEYTEKRRTFRSLRRIRSSISSTCEKSCLGCHDVSFTATAILRRHYRPHTVVIWDLQAKKKKKNPGGDRKAQSSADIGDSRDLLYYRGRSTTSAQARLSRRREKDKLQARLLKKNEKDRRQGQSPDAVKEAP